MEQPKIPTLKDAQKPQIKMRGLGAGLSLLDRLKQFKKKDLAFILAGLGTLFMAPLAEHFMMSPDGGDGQLQQGWGGGRGGSGIFGGGGSPYESGSNSISQGSAIGGAGDIITPLNVRDPSALVMGPGATQQPPAGSMAPPTGPTPPMGPSAQSEPDLRDALKGAAARAGSAAASRAPLPMPKVALGGSGLRGLGVAGGGSSASAGLGAPGAAGGGTPGTGGGGLNLVQRPAGFKGVARGGNNPQGLENTKRLAAAAGDAFSRAGSALANANEAAKGIGNDGSTFGGIGQGGATPNDKGGSGSGPGGSKSVGESLAFLLAKERAMKELELEFEKRKLKDLGLLWYNIRNEGLKTLSQELIKKSMTWGSKDDGGKTLIHCPGFKGGEAFILGDSVKKCEKDNLPCYNPNTNTVLDRGGTFGPCVVSGKKIEATPGNGSAKPVVGGVVGGMTGAVQNEIQPLCKELKAYISAAGQQSEGGGKVIASEGSQRHYTAMLGQAKTLLDTRAILFKEAAPDGDCGVRSGNPVNALLLDAKDRLVKVDAQPAVLPQLAKLAWLDKDSAGAKEAAGHVAAQLKATDDALTEAKSQLEKATQQLGTLSFKLSEDDQKRLGKVESLRTLLVSANQARDDMKTKIGAENEFDSFLGTRKKLADISADLGEAAKKDGLIDQVLKHNLDFTDAAARIAKVEEAVKEIASQDKRGKLAEAFAYSDEGELHKSAPARTPVRMDMERLSATVAAKSLAHVVDANPADNPNGAIPLIEKKFTEPTAGAVKRWTDEKDPEKKKAITADVDKNIEGALKMLQINEGDVVAPPLAVRTLRVSQLKYVNGVIEKAGGSPVNKDGQLVTAKPDAEEDEDE